MKKIIRFFKFIAMGSFSLILTACYGVMYGVPYKAIDGKVSIKNSNGEPIKGLKLTLLESGYNQPTALVETDINGQTDFSIDNYSLSDYNILVQDTDGQENLGYFQSELVPVISDNQPGGETEIVELAVEMVEQNIQGSFSILDDSNNPVSGFYVSDASSEIPQSADGRYYFTADPGKNNSILIENRNSDDWVFNDIDTNIYQFRPTGGDFSVIVQNKSADANAPVSDPETGNIRIYDEMGADCLAAANAYYISEMTIDDGSESRSIDNADISNGQISVQIDLSKENTLSVRWVDSLNIQHNDSFPLFKGNQVIILK